MTNYSILSRQLLITQGISAKKKAIHQAFDDKYEAAIALVERKALEQQVVLYEENGAVSFSPVVDGKALDDSEFANLSEEKRQFFYDLVSDLETILNEQLLELPQWKRELSENLRSIAP